MGLEVGGYNDRPDWPKLGPSLLIASALILAIRTAKWPAAHDERLSNNVGRATVLSTARRDNAKTLIAERLRLSRCAEICAKLCYRSGFPGLLGLPGHCENL